MRSGWWWSSSVPSTRITVSGVPPFLPNIPVENELRRFGKLACGLRAVSLGCKDPKLKHVRSLRRQVFMLLDSPHTDTGGVPQSPTRRRAIRGGRRQLGTTWRVLSVFETRWDTYTHPHVRILKQRADSHSVDAAGGSAAPGSAEGTVPGRFFILFRATGQVSRDPQV